MDSPLRGYESEAYSPVMVDDLLKGLNDWRNIQDIVRLTFKALSDVVRTQGQAIRDLERQLPLKVSRNEFNIGLSQKANSDEIEELQTALESRVPYLDIQILSEDKVSRSDVQYLLSNKPSVEEVRNLLEGKVNVRDLDSEISILRNHFDDVLRDLSRKFSQFPNERELDFLHGQLKDKVSHDEFREALDLKANKQTVTAALQTKLDRYNFEEILGQKPEFGDSQRILAALESKADYSLFEQLHVEMQNKVDREDFGQFVFEEISKKAEKFEVELLVKDIKTAVDKNFLEHSATTDAYINSFKADLEQTRRTLNAAMTKKVEGRDIEKLYSVLSKKADFEVTVELLEKIKYECRDMMNEAKREMKKAEDFDFRYRLEGEISRIKEGLDILMRNHSEENEERNLYFKSVTVGVKADVQREINKVIEEIKYTQETLQDLIKSRVDKNEFSDVKSLLCETQKGLDKHRQNTDVTNEEVFASLRAFRDDVQGKFKNFELQMSETLSQKVNLFELPKLMENKLDMAQASKQLGIKTSQEDISYLKKELEKTRIDLSRKSNSSDLDSHIQSTQIALEDVAKDMLLKCNIKDVCALLDMKANIDDTNKALSEIHKELDNKLNSGDFSSHVNDYSSIIEALCAENCLGRWLWKSGELKSGNLVPWELQNVNTAPDNFLWEKEKISIVTVAPGLYQIVLGFYSRKKPTIQILVNGEPIMSAVNTSSYVVHHSSGKLKPVAHPNGNIAGLTLIDFIALPARARISIGYSGEIHSEGFIELRKL